jgi:hypothetical protein
VVKWLTSAFSPASRLTRHRNFLAQDNKNAEKASVSDDLSIARGRSKMRGPHDEAIFELVKFYVDAVRNEHPNPAVADKLREEFEKKRTELEALVGPSFRNRFRQKIKALTPGDPQSPQTLWQRLRAMLLNVAGGA